MIEIPKLHEGSSAASENANAWRNIRVLNQTLCEVIEALEDLEKVVKELKGKVKMPESERLSKAE
jgi:predicted nucleotide-binding protein (sugar kinase/HSP70/actin superfamily)